MRTALDLKNQYAGDQDPPARPIRRQPVSDHYFRVRPTRSSGDFSGYTILFMKIYQSSTNSLLTISSTPLSSYTSDV